MATNAAVFKQTLSFKSLRLLERTDLKSNYKSFSDSELLKQDILKTRNETVLEKCKSESNLSTCCKNLIINEPNREEKLSFKSDEAQDNKTEPETKFSDENENHAHSVVQSTDTNSSSNKNSRRLNLMSVTSILQGMFNITGDYNEAESKTAVSKNRSKRSKSRCEKQNPETDQNQFSVTESKIAGISNVCAPNPLLDCTVASGENFLAEPRCLTLKKYNPNIDPFLTDDSLIFEPDFEDEIEPLEPLSVKKTENLEDITKDIFFDDDELLPRKKISVTDREEGELTPEQHSAAAAAEDTQEQNTNATLNADFFNKINECLRDIDKKCRELHSSSIQKYSIKNLQRILSNVDNIKRKLSFLINSKKSDNERKNKSDRSLEKYSRNGCNNSHEPISKLDYDCQFNSFSNTKENENNKICNQLVLEEKETAHVSKQRHDSKERHSRRRSSRERPSQSELLNRKKISILEKLGTKQEIERIQSLFKRQMNLITQHVIQKKETNRTFRKRESERSKKHYSSRRQSGSNSKKSHENIDLSELKTLEDMEAFLDSLKNKTSDKALVKKYINEDKMKGVLKFTSKKEKKIEESKSMTGKTLIPLQSLETDILKQSLSKDDSILIENDAVTAKLDNMGEKEKDCETNKSTGYIAKTHTLWEYDKETINTKQNSLHDIISVKTVDKINNINTGNFAKTDLNETNRVSIFSGERYQNDYFCEEDNFKYRNNETSASGKPESDSTMRSSRKEENWPQSKHSNFNRISKEREKQTSKKKRKNDVDYFDWESITEEQISKKRRRKSDDDSETKQLREQEKLSLNEKEQKQNYYSKSLSVMEQEKHHSNKHKEKKHLNSKTLAEQDYQSLKRNQKKKENDSDSKSVVEEEKIRSKRTRKNVKNYSGSEIVTDKEKQNHRKERNEDYYSQSESESVHEQRKQFAKRNTKEHTEHSYSEMSVEDTKNISNSQESFMDVSEEMEIGNEEQQRKSKTRCDSGENLTVDANESLMRDLLSKNIYILGDENLASLDSQFRIKVIGNEIYLKKANCRGKRKSHSRRESKLKSLEFENVEKDHGGYCTKEPIDPEKVNSALKEMENFLQELRSKKKVSDDDQQTLDITNHQSREEKFLARIQAKRKAKLMACVSAAPYSIEKEAKVLKALEKRDGELSESSDVESHKQKLMEKLRAETDAIVLAQKSGGKHSTTDDDPLRDVKALLNMIKEAESTDDGNAKQVYVSFQLKKSDMKKLENLTEKPLHISEESQKLLNNVRAKMRAKKAPSSNLSSLMLKPEE